MPIKAFGKKYKTFGRAVAAAKRKGKRNPKAYIATIERTIAKRRAAKRKK